MLDRLTGKPVHLIAHLTACSLIAAGLPASKIPLSVGTMLLLLNLLLEAKFKIYGANLKSAIRANYFFPAFILLLFASLGWTANFRFAGEYFRIILPLILIPPALFAKPVSDGRHQNLVIGFFLAGTFVTSLLNVGFYQHWWGDMQYDDFRGLSLFASHIRYALIIVFALAVCIHRIVAKFRHRWLYLLLSLWFVWYTDFSQILSGYLALGGVAALAFFFILRSLRSKTAKVVIASSALLLIAGCIMVIADIMKPAPHKISLEDLPRRTANGNPYRHESPEKQKWENGYPVVAFINEDELGKAWNAVSDIDYAEGPDAKGQPLDYTLWLYMTSKGLTKDSAGFAKMTREDISNVEHGFTSVLLTNGGWKSRLYGIRHQIENSTNPNGHSLLQRIEYWKAGCSIISQHPVAGVGVGDIDDAFRDHYRQSHSKLDEELRHRAHNQFMTSWIIAGAAGFLAFFLWWGKFLVSAWKSRSFMIASFAVIVLLSFLVEDTLETQVGVTFVAFFYALLAPGARKRSALAISASLLH
jgi:hypothetical protein